MGSFGINEKLLIIRQKVVCSQYLEIRGETLCCLNAILLMVFQVLLTELVQLL